MASGCFICINIIHIHMKKEVSLPHPVRRSKGDKIVPHAMKTTGEGSCISVQCSVFSVQCSGRHEEEENGQIHASIALLRGEELTVAIG
jgi:hypothetical protein